MCGPPPLKVDFDLATGLRGPRAAQNHPPFTFLLAQDVIAMLDIASDDPYRANATDPVGTFRIHHNAHLGERRCQVKQP